MNESKQVEKALRESQERFYTLVQNALDIIMVTDAGGTIKYMSPSVERVLGYQPEEIVGTNTAEYVHPDDLMKGYDELAKVANGKPIFVTYPTLIPQERQGGRPLRRNRREITKRHRDCWEFGWRRQDLGETATRFLADHLC